ncbi:MAG: glycoside hydrolase family 3 C-terminal domain-containing protein [Lachnospiraceae bacterium]|nr:glycoside hydrolase family 3 C-terminal domain-containing protein [Lachnospiraceae bacterium]
MVNLLARLLGPFFGSLGVSEADLLSYLTQLQGYIYGILAALVVMIVVMVAACKAKKGFKHVIRWEAALAFLMVVLVLANVICYGPMYTNVSGFLNASKVELSDETVAQSKDVIKRVGEEGFVMVKNEGLLPLDAEVTNLNVFGWDSTNPLFGGTGSGSSDASKAVGILQSLTDAGYTTNETLTNMYKEYREDRPGIGMKEQDWTLPEPTVDAYTDAIMTEAKEFSDTAVIVIGRSGGEGADLPMDMNAVIKGTYNPAEEISAAPANFGYMNASYTNNGSYDDFEEGESYLELSRTEEDMVEKVCSEFDNVVVIINANNTMELGWVDEYEQIGAVILAPGAGATGFAALGEIINGTVNPSGKTVDTYVKDLMKTPYINNFGNMPYNNVDDLKQQLAEADGAFEGNIAFANYVEGIYVGYKFYETAAEEGLINFDDYVQYPFGYGLSYTSFSKTIENFADNGDSISFDVVVTNTGDVAGKDVAEIYFNPPYTNGGIEKASVNLIEFEKTDIIEPGASQTVSFNINKEDLAAYDSEGIKIANGGYILEAGTYTISVRSDSHTVDAEASFEVAADIDYSKDGRSSDGIPAVNQFQDYARGDFEQLSRKDGFANYESACGQLKAEAFEMSDEVRAAVVANAVVGYDGTAFNNDADEMPVMGADNGLKLFDLKGAAYDDERWEQLLDQLSFEDMSTMINIGGWQTAKIESVGKVATSDCDGPAGLNNFITQAYGTAYPSEVLMAQTWSKALAYEIGQAMGQEYEDANNFGWYGPAMNTHRSAFAGRNFEYYSEDGVLGGLFAAQQINGAAEHGVYAYIKHFALNDQETNRCSFLLTFASEQAIREIYLKPFELAVKGFEGTAQAAMSAFNFIGTESCHANANLLKTVLRDEWGFVGMVETDYNGSYGYQITDHCIRTGNDLMLGFGSAASNVLADESATAVLAMREACKNIMYTIVNSGFYAGDSDPTGGMTPMTKLFMKVDIIGGVVLLGAAALVLARYFSKKKKAA